MFRTVLNSKIGELLNFLASKIPYLSLTKTLKLIYLIDEGSVRKSGVPVTWLDYKVWKNGPVSSEVYQEIKHNQKITINDSPVSLDNYIIIEKKINNNRGQEEIYIKPNKNIDLSEFSEDEQDLIKDIIIKYGSFTASDLIALLHQEGTLWDKHCKEHQLQKQFELYSNTSNVSIDFSELIEDDPIKQMAAQAAYESLQFHEKLIES